MDLPMVLACLLPEVLFSLTQTSGLANLAHTMEMITISFSPCFLFQIKGEICLVSSMSSILYSIQYCINGQREEL